MKRKIMIMVLAMTMSLSASPVMAAEFTDGGVQSVQELPAPDLPVQDFTSGAEAGEEIPMPDTGWTEDPETGKYFYYNEGGEPQYGWVILSGERYFVKSEAPQDYMIQQAEGEPALEPGRIENAVVSIDGQWYTFNKNGEASLLQEGTEETGDMEIFSAPAEAPALDGDVVDFQYVSLSWTKAEGADGYEVYGYNSGKKTYSLIATVGKDTFSYKKKIGYARDGRFKIRSFTGQDGAKEYGPFSNDVLVQTACAAPKITSVKSAGSKALTVSWSKSASADGYQIYRYIQKNGNYKLVKTITNGNTTSFKNTGLVNGRQYYYKIKAYRILDNGGKIFSDFCSPVSGKAAASSTDDPVNIGSTATGAVIPEYENVVVKEVDPEDFDRTFNKALLEAGENADRTTQYKIIIPPGNYQAGRRYMIPSNTYVYMVGATVNATGTRVGMWNTDTQNPSENIIMEGGTWTTMSQPASVDGTVVRLVGVRNLVMKNMTIKTKRSGHIIEAADVNGFTVTGCTISGNNKDAKEPYKSIQPKEALQLDVATASAVPGYDHPASMLNGKGCHNVLITNNTFSNCGRGVGSHSGTGNGAESRPYTNITVSGNTITNALGEGIFGQDWRDCTISGNTVTNAKQAGIYLLDTANVRVSGNKIGKINKYTGSRKTTYDPNGDYGVGVLLRRSNTVYMDNNKFQKLYGGIIQEANNKNVTLKNNKTSNLK